MNTLSVVQRIVLGIVLVILGLVSPLWVLVIFVGAAGLAIPVYIEGVILVMAIEWLARDFIGFGVVGWVCLLWILLCESRRSLFSYSYQ